LPITRGYQRRRLQAVAEGPGKRVESRSGAVIGEVRVSSDADIAVSVRQARAAQPAWQALGVAGRVKALGPAANTVSAIPVV
jgi:acyl-CoA reductase-like NAD-dependent aldehyde dehydrogenase